MFIIAECPQDLACLQNHCSGKWHFIWIFRTILRFRYNSLKLCLISVCILIWNVFISCYSVDPCPASCGFYSFCKTVLHQPKCYCEEGYTGDPYSSCVQIRQPEPIAQIPLDPCNPSPCGSNAVCSTLNGAGK